MNEWVTPLAAIEAQYEETVKAIARLCATDPDHPTASEKQLVQYMQERIAALRHREYELQRALALAKGKGEKVH